MVAFRDSEGRYGLIDEFCAHRGASLWFGRNEGSGLRCPYHGWKYDVTGQAIEVPSEPENSSFCAHVKLTSYPLVKIGDVLWTYMGDPDKRPPLPEFEFAQVPPEQTYTSKRWQECNWLQAFEGGIDSSHVSFLHSGGLKTDPLFKGAKGNEYNMADLKPFFEVADAEGGLFVGARRNAEDGTYYWRITPWVMPNFTMVPPRGDHPVHGHFWIPIDDENCWAYSFDYHPVRALTATEVQAMLDGHGVHSENIPGTYRPAANKDNDYLIDREAQKRGDTYSGVKGIAMQDASLQESMGPIVDRTKERAGLRRQRHHQGPPEAAKAVDRAAGRGRDAPRRRPGPPPGAVGRGRAAAGSSRSSTPAASAVGHARACGSVGLTASTRPILRQQLRQGDHRRRGAVSASTVRSRSPRRAGHRRWMTGRAIVGRISHREWGHARFLHSEGLSAIPADWLRIGRTAHYRRRVSSLARRTRRTPTWWSWSPRPTPTRPRPPSSVRRARAARIMTAGLVLGDRYDGRRTRWPALRPYARVLLVSATRATSSNC